MNIRVGFGYDVHKLVEGRELWLGGIKLENPTGALGHSDADVLIHAICDALLGAAGLGDIGSHFPDTSPEYKDIDSKILLKRVIELLAAKGYHPVNIDATLALQKPVIAPYIPAMRSKLAEVMGLTPDEVSIKATTTERLGFEGREEGVSAYAVVLIEKDLKVY
jgi:2-C-methyl-D-erythritol 2,4-cyclodiphosphate synthase